MNLSTGAIPSYLTFGIAYVLILFSFQIESTAELESGLGLSEHSHRLRRSWMTLSRVVRAMREKKRVKTRDLLLTTLSHLDDALTLQMMWAINALQGNDAPKIATYLRYPKEAATTDLTSKYFAHKWEIENLLLLLLSTPKKKVNFLRAPDYRSFDTVAHLLNQLKTAEDAESGVLINETNVLDEMQRYAHKQFLWQREFFEIERMYRYTYVYGQGKCAAYFAEKNGLSIDEFILTSFALYYCTRTNAWQNAPRFEPPLTLRPELVGLTLKLISKELSEMRTDTTNRIKEVMQAGRPKLAYLPSSLRHFPIISSAKNNDKIIAPLPQLVIYRATSGLYYDLAGGPQVLLEEANDRFEEYGKKLIEARCPRFEVSRDQEYGPKTKRMRTPDLLLKDDGVVKAVFECKATKLTFAAQYGDDQFAEAPTAFYQIAKGMSQLWKFFSRVRRGVFNNETVADDAHGIILTMENWFQLDRRQLPLLREAAEKLCEDEPDMIPEDKRDIIFCSIESLDSVLAVSNEDELLETFGKAREKEYLGWMLNDVRNPYQELTLVRKDYPFSIDDVLPLWKEVAR